MFEIGYSLRAARERQGIGHPEAELATKIRAKYLRALEEEDFAALPADTYTRGFLRTYADYLGLDGEIYVDEYSSRFHNNEWEDDLRPAPRSRPRRPQRERTFGRRAVILALTFIAVITALTVGAWMYRSPSSPTGVVGRHKHHKPRQLVLTGARKGTFVVVHRQSRKGPLLFSGTLTSGRVERFTGKRFYVSARRPSGVRVTKSPGVTVLGG